MLANATRFISLPVHNMLIHLPPESLLELHMYTNNLQKDMSAIIKVKKKNKNHNDKLTVNLQNFCILSVLALNWLELSCKRLSGGKLCLCFLSWTVQAADTRSNSRQIDRSAFFSSWEINRGICSKVLFFFLFFFLGHEIMWTDQCPRAVNTPG